MKPTRFIVGLTVFSTLIAMVMLLVGIAMLLGFDLGSTTLDATGTTAGGLFLLSGGAAYLLVILGLVRQSVLGYPRVHIAPEGLHVGPAFVPWEEIRSIDALAVQGEPYIGVDVAASATRACRRIDRLGEWIYSTSGMPRLMLTAQQLGMSVDDAIAKMAACGGDGPLRNSFHRGDRR